MSSESHAGGHRPGHRPITLDSGLEGAALCFPAGPPAATVESGKDRLSLKRRTWGSPESPGSQKQGPWESKAAGTPGMAVVRHRHVPAGLQQTSHHRLPQLPLPSPARWVFSRELHVTPKGKRKRGGEGPCYHRKQIKHNTGVWGQGVVGLRTAQGCLQAPSCQQSPRPGPVAGVAAPTPERGVQCRRRDGGTDGWKRAAGGCWGGWHGRPWPGCGVLSATDLGSQESALRVSCQRPVPAAPAGLLCQEVRA